MGIGKPRTKLGEWLDKRGMRQEWLRDKLGVSKNTITSLCNDPGYAPNLRTIQAILKALREVDASVRASDFWDV